MANAEVLVAGAGPVGLFIAHSLARAGVSVEIIDAGMWPCAHSYALALHPRAVELISSAGGAADLVNRGSQVRRLALYDERGRRADINLASATGQPMLVLPQSALEEHLEHALNRAGVEVQWRHKVMRVQPNGRTVHVEMHRYEKVSCGYAIAAAEWSLADSWNTNFDFVVGADGYNSAVRRSIDIRFPEVAPAAWYAVFEFRSDADIKDEVRVVFGEQTTDVLWPLGAGLYRWSFELPGYVDPETERLAAYRERFGMPSDRTKDRLQFTSGETGELLDGQLTEYIAQRAPWFNGSILDVQWRTIVRFERRLADTFGRDRCWLSGDAAHLGSPVGVQSLNIGLAEANDLSDAIVRTLHDGNGSDWLALYNKRYICEWKRLSGCGTLIEGAKDVNPWIWQNRNRLLPCLPAHGAELSLLASQLGLRV